MRISKKPKSSPKKLESLEDKALGVAIDAAKKENLGHVNTEEFKKKLKSK